MFISLSVCVCECVSVPLWTKYKSSRLGYTIDNLLRTLWATPILTRPSLNGCSSFRIGNLGSKLRVTGCFLFWFWSEFSIYIVFIFISSWLKLWSTSWLAYLSSIFGDLEWEREGDIGSKEKYVDSTFMWSSCTYWFLNPWNLIQKY